MVTQPVGVIIVWLRVITVKSPFINRAVLVRVGIVQVIRSIVCLTNNATTYAMFDFLLN